MNFNCGMQTYIKKKHDCAWVDFETIIGGR